MDEIENVENNVVGMDTTGIDQEIQTSTEASIANPEAVVEATQPVAKPSDPNVAVVNPYDWTKDSRFEKMWGKKPEGLYKSYKSLENELEKTYKPMRQSYESFSKVFKENNIEPEKLQDYIKEYQTLKDPKNPMNERANYLSYWLDNPVHAPQIEAFFKNLERAELEKMYPGMNEKQIQEHMEMKKTLEEFKREKAEKEFQQSVQKATEEINGFWSKAEKHAVDRGFVLDMQSKQQLYDYCIKNRIEASQMWGAFLSLFNEGIEKAYTKRVEDNLMKKLNKNNQTSVPPAANFSKKPVTASGKTLFEKLTSSLS